MKKISMTILLAVCIFTVIAVESQYTDQEREIMMVNSIRNQEGAREYIPTRIEWLILELNARYASEKLQFGFRTNETGKGDPTATSGHTVEARVYYTTETLAAEKQKQMQTAKQRIIELATSYNWQTWVAVEGVFVLKGIN